MKKDRDCGMAPYPVYQPYPQVMPGMVAPGMMSPMMTPGNVQMPMQYSNMQNNVASNTIDQQLNQMQRQINNLENRVSKLENSLNTIGNTALNSNQFTSGNYHIV